MRGVATALFSSTRPKNSENENISLCLKIAEIDKGDQSWVKRTILDIKTQFFGDQYPYLMTCSLFPRENLWHHICKARRAISLKFCIKNAFIAIMTHAKFHCNWLTSTLIFGIGASEFPFGPGKWRKRPGPIGLTLLLPTGGGGWSSNPP